jgi:hypothetical protein
MRTVCALTVLCVRGVFCKGLKIRHVSSQLTSNPGYSQNLEKWDASQQICGKTSNIPLHWLGAVADGPKAGQSPWVFAIWERTCSCGLKRIL